MSGSESTVIFSGQSSTGENGSLTVTSKEHWDDVPWPFAAIYVTVVGPRLNSCVPTKPFPLSVVAPVIVQLISPGETQLL